MGYDDLYSRRKRIEFEKEEPNFQRQDATRRTEDKIMEVITINRKNGIAHQKLARIIGINRKNLGKYISRLITRGLVVRGPGLRGKYYPSTKEHRETSMSAEILGGVIASTILYDSDLKIKCPLFRRSEQEIENALFVFSNKVGAIITYLLIQSMNPLNKFSGNTKNSVESDLNVETWIDDVITTLRPALLPSIKEHVGQHLESLNHGAVNSKGLIKYDHNKSVGAFIKYLYDRPTYELSDTIISELMTTFSTLYPNLSKKFERIRSVLPQLVAKEVEHWEYMENKFEHQKVCRHDYRTPTNKTLEEYADDQIKHCRKCHKTKRK
jgi:predicted transcriptional regulator